MPVMRFSLHIYGRRAVLYSKKLLKDSSLTTSARRRSSISAILLLMRFSTSSLVSVGLPSVAVSMSSFLWSASLCDLL